MRLLLCDISNVFFSAWHAGQDKPVGFAYEVTISRIRRAAERADYVVVCCDSGRSFRKDLAPDYKAGRPERDPMLIEQLQRTQATLEADGYMVAKADGFEADDLIASLVEWARPQDIAVEVLSSDKDLLALVGPNVRVRSVRTDELLGPEQVLAKFGIRPAQMTDYLALVGDASDNIRGVAGIGAKHAARLLGQFGSLSGIIEALDGKDERDEPLVRPPSIHAAISAALRDGSLITARQLVALRTDVPLDFDAALVKRAPQPVRPDFGADLNEDTMEPESNAEPIQAPTPTTELARVEPLTLPIESRWALEPRSMKDTVWLAAKLFESRLLNGYGSPEQALAIIMAGREMGLGAMTALRGINIIKGRISMGASLMVGLCLASGKALYFDMVESTPKVASYVTKRKGSAREIALSFTIEQARALNLVRPQTPWDTDPENMLRHRCSSRLARVAFPDVVSNCFLPDELEDA